MKTSIFVLLLLLTLLIPAFPFPAQQPSTNELIALARQYIELLAKEDFSAAVKTYDATMTKVFPEEKTRETWVTVKAQAGAFKKQGGTRTQKLGIFDIIFVTCEFEKMTLEAKIVFNAQQQIAGLGFKPPVSQVQKPDSIVEREITVGAGEW